MYKNMNTFEKNKEQEYSCRHLYFLTCLRVSVSRRWAGAGNRTRRYDARDQMGGVRLFPLSRPGISSLYPCLRWYSWEYISWALLSVVCATHLLWAGYIVILWQQVRVAALAALGRAGGWAWAEAREQVPCNVRKVHYC